jgi:UDP-N-acetylmuramoylalanine--D-glutamate ligase
MSGARGINLKGVKATVMGLGRHGGGLGVTRWLAKQGCRVTVTDSQPAERLAESLAQLADVPVEALHLGGHLEDDFTKTELLVVNPAVKPGHPLVALAAARGARIVSEIALFLERCPANVVGITGTTGKSTTATMLAEILRADGRTTWLGGNLGGSLLGDLDAMRAEDVVVLELSSFQLAQLDSHVTMPRLGVVTNCTPNHLDWHGTWPDYVAAKQRLLTAERVILNRDDAEVSQWALRAPDLVVPLVAENTVPAVAVPGAHNRQNARLAATAARHLQVGETAIQNALGRFRGLSHRLETVGEVAGRHLINDSKATSPAAMRAAIAAIDGPIWLLAGGADQQLDVAQFIDALTEQVRGIALFGLCRNKLLVAIRDQLPKLPVVAVENLDAAMAWAFEQSTAGDTILLSPACASFDQYTDFAARGEAFVTRVRQMEGRGVY